MSGEDEQPKEVIHYRDGTLEVEFPSVVLSFSAEARGERPPTRQPGGVSALDAPAHSSMGDAISATPEMGSWASPDTNRIAELEAKVARLTALLAQNRREKE
jgi:hypothetical protein